jgi:hypothetical protein
MSRASEASGFGAARAAAARIFGSGRVPDDADGARLLFQVVSAACGSQSVVFTTNLEFSKWGAVLGDDQMAAAAQGRPGASNRPFKWTRTTGFAPSGRGWRHDCV